MSMTALPEVLFLTVSPRVHCSLFIGGILNLRGPHSRRDPNTFYQESHFEDLRLMTFCV